MRQQYDRRGNRKRRPINWHDSRLWAFAGGFVGLALATCCCWPWVAETVKIAKLMLEHW